MYRSKKLLKEVLFKHVEGREIPMQPWPQSFYISDEFLRSGEIEVRPLTVTGIIKGIGTNFITMSVWRFYRVFFKVGFLDIPEGECPSFKRHWRWMFWRVLKQRRRKVEASRIFIDSLDMPEYCKKTLKGREE